MTSEMFAALIPAAAAVLVTAMLCAAALAAWRGWLALKQMQLTAAPAADAPVEPVGQDQDVGVRIELAAVKERLRQLEAIAAGVEL